MSCYGNGVRTDTKLDGPHTLDRFAGPDNNIFGPLAPSEPVNAGEPE